MRKIIVALFLVGCGSDLDAKTACEKLTGQGLGASCTKDSPGGLGAAAWEKYDFEIPEPKGKKCQVLAHKSDADLEGTIKGFDAAAGLAGPHRYSNKAKRIFVQCNSDMPREAGEKIEAAVKAL